MVAYNWECIKCGHNFETMQKMGVSSPECPECRGETRKQLGAPVIKFKGGGWADEGYQPKGK